MKKYSQTFRCSTIRASIVATSVADRWTARTADANGRVFIIRMTERGRYVITETGSVASTVVLGDLGNVAHRLDLLTQGAMFDYALRQLNARRLAARTI